MARVCVSKFYYYKRLTYLLRVELLCFASRVLTAHR